MAPKRNTNNTSLFEQIFKKNSLPTILLEADDYIIVDANNFAEIFFGVPVSQLANKQLGEFSNISIESFNDALDAFIRNKYSGLEHTFITNNLGKRDVEIHYSVISANSKKQLLCILVDVTERNQTLRKLRDFKNDLTTEVRKQTQDLIRINNALLEQVANRRTAENELRKSQEMFMLVFQLNPSGMVLRNLTTNSIVEVNNRFLKTFGLIKETVIGRRVEELDIMCDTIHFVAVQNELTKENAIRNVPLSMMSRQGHAVFVEFSSQVIGLSNGDFALEVYQDVTQTTIIQQKLAVREEQYRTMFNNALVGIVRSEMSNGLVISCNKQYSSMLGYESVSDIVGKSIYKHFIDEHQRRDYLKNLLKIGPVVKEFELKTKDNRKLWVVNYSTVNKLERYIDEVVVDITDRKLMEDLLATSENRFRSMIENASDLILIVNTEGKFLYLSPSVHNELGYPIDNPGNVVIFDYICPEHIQTMQMLLCGELPFENTYEVNVKHIDGSCRTYEVKATNLVNNSALGGIVINAHDITLQIKARDELNAILAKELELSRQKTLFISTVSHEFRTPLTNLSLNIQLLNKFIENGKVDKASQCLERMINGEKRLVALLNEISLISKDQSGRLQYTPNFWNLNLLIDDLLEQISYLIQPNIKVNIIKGQNINVKMDRNLLLHILTNLLNNATKYTPNEKEINVVIEVEQHKTLNIIVADNGIGIPDNELEFLFEPYFRASNVKQVNGSGLGLSIVKRCVDLHNGSISVTSKLGEGTTVKCSIPIVES